MKKQIIAAVILIVSLVFFFNVNSSYAQKKLAEPPGLAVLTSAATTANDPVIVTESGRLQGTVGTQMIEYLGIPYAKPPVGMLRWRPPKAFRKWRGVFEATAFGNECPQMNTMGAVVGACPAWAAIICR